MANTDILEGGGIRDIFNKIKNTIVGLVKSPTTTIAQNIPSLDKYTTNAQKYISRYGQLKVIQLAVEKEPVNPYVMKLANFLSAFELQKIMQQNGIDKFYHISLKIEILDYQGNVQTLLVEKNDTINIEMWKQKPNMQILNIDLNSQEFTFNEMLERTRLMIGDKQFFEYNFLTANCGLFCIDVLKANYVYQTKYETFLYQNMGIISKKMSNSSKSRMSIITKLGALFTHARGGELEQVKFI
jgi:hypothetical protein